MNSENKTQPDHYKTKQDFDVIDFNKAYNLNFNLGNVVKYIARAGKKEGESSLDDLKKALEYLQREFQSIGIFSFIRGEHPSSEEKNCFLEEAKRFIHEYTNNLKTEKDNSIETVLKQHVIGYCINCDNHTELIYFNDIDLFMCRECHDLQTGKEREEKLNTVNTCPADGSDIEDLLSKCQFMAFAPVAWNCDDEEEETCKGCLDMQCDCNKPEQNQQKSASVETFTLDQVTKAVNNWSMLPVHELDVLNFFDK